MVIKRSAWVVLAIGIAMVPTLMYMKAHGSDHADTPAIAAQPGLDLTDVFIFPSPTNPSNVVLAMNVHPLIPTGQSAGVGFDPNVLYQFKIDNTGDHVEDLVIQARFSGSGANQTVFIAGPAAPERTGTVTTALAADSVTGVLNQPFTTSNGVKVFAGPREDPFFFDLNQFFTILPDRATPITGTAISNPIAPQATSWRPAGQAQDFLAGLNVLSIVVELPKSALVGSGNGKIGVWCTTSK